MAKPIIRQAMIEGHIDITMKNFEIIEPFMYYMDAIREVYAEVKING